MIAAWRGEADPERPNPLGLLRQSILAGKGSTSRDGGAANGLVRSGAAGDRTESRGISADEKIVLHLDVWLFTMEQIFRLPSQKRRAPPGYKYIKSIKCHGPSEELKNLDKALCEWINADFESKEIEKYGVFKNLSQNANHTSRDFGEWLQALSVAISSTITWLESAAPNIRQRQAVETSLFIALNEKYVELSGSKRLSDEGPGIRFMRECASILGMAAPDGLRRRVQQAKASRQEKPPQPPPDFFRLD